MATARQFPNEYRESKAEEISAAQKDERARREDHLDKTIADSFPASDPPSTIPNPT